jgi:hypothetical protein
VLSRWECLLILNVTPGPHILVRRILNKIVDIISTGGAECCGVQTPSRSSGSGRSGSLRVEVDSLGLLCESSYFLAASDRRYFSCGHVVLPASYQSMPLLSLGLVALAEYAVLSFIAPKHIRYGPMIQSCWKSVRTCPARWNILCNHFCYSAFCA